MSMATSNRIKGLENIVIKQTVEISELKKSAANYAEEIGNLNNQVKEIYELILAEEIPTTKPTRKAKPNGQTTHRRA